MKYGETLRQRSIPAWSHHNIDYDDIKHFIKERTTPGKGKTVSVPGRPDEKLLDFESTLLQILEDQHDRLNSFVKSKSGEIQRRLTHAKKQLRRLSSRNVTAGDRRISIGKLERYGNLENDVLKAGDEIKSLARFTGTQRTAFRKLLKKYKKWTGSTNLETRFREEVLDDPKSFTKLDLGSLLDEYSQTLQDIRSLFESRLQPKSTNKTPTETSHDVESSVVERLKASLNRGSRVEFDTAVATIPLGEGGALANFFVHPESVVELQVFLLQHMQYYTSRSRSNSTATPVSPTKDSSPVDGLTARADYFMLVADNLDRFAQEQSAVTVNEREHVPGLPPQRAKVLVRWNEDEDAVIAARSSLSKVRCATLKSKHLESFFDKSAPLPKRKAASFADDEKTLSAIREDVLQDPSVQPLYQISSCRSRFIGVNSGVQSVLIATLDTSVSMEKAGQDAGANTRSDFPFAVLQVRQEGSGATELLSSLNQSHLLERVRGFSLQYHALWQTCRPANLAPPFWMSILSRDIRKLPPPAIKHSGSSEGSSGAETATRQSVSASSAFGNTDSTTAVETERASSGPFPESLGAPPLRSFRKKRRRQYPETSVKTQERYWSEYDNPEEGEGSDAFVLYIDPNEKSTIDKLFDRVSGLFGGREPAEEPLLQSPTADDDETSDEEEAAGTRGPSYGTLDEQHSSSRRHSNHPNSRHTAFLPQSTTICLIASIAILVVAYILATTSKHKYATEVNSGVIFGIVCSLLFAIIGFAPLLSRTDGTWLSFSVATLILIVDAVASGGLLAWMLG